MEEFLIELKIIYAKIEARLGTIWVFFFNL